MRTPTRLSHSGFALWESNPTEFALKYLVEHRPPRVPQEHPAAAGSAFDAYAKAHLQHALDGTNYGQRFQELFEAQVEPQNRDWAIEEGKYIFECYKVSGFYDELLDLLQKAKNPRFEFTVDATINGVPFTGKPDCQASLKDSLEIVHDFKLNGYCSKNTTSPHKSYMKCRDGWVGKASKHSRSHDKEHKEFLAQDYKGLTTNTSYLEAANPSWADQLSLYGWALGEKIGDENVVLSIHQIVASPSIPRPKLRVASYRARVSQAYQLKLAERLKTCWDAIHGHVFLDVAREESDQRCADLEEMAIGLMTHSNCNEFVRAKYRG